MPYYFKNMKDRLPGVLEQIKSAMYKRISELDISVWITPEPVTFEDRMSGVKKDVAIGQSWGNLWDCGWFHFTGAVPDASETGANDEEIILLIDINGELCVVDNAGNPVRGLTNFSSEFDYSLGRPGKIVYRFDRPLKAGDKVEIWADAGCNDLFGKYQDSGTVKDAYIAVANKEMEQLYYDFEVLLDLLQQLPEDKARYHGILRALNEAANILTKYDNAEAKRARAILAAELNKKGGDPSLRINAIGHAHIDLAWLWPIRETIRKGARTFSTALRNMERFPEYIFGASQAQLYQWVKEYYPALYEEVKQRIREGRWEVQGAMWVEADTNVSGGEALIRQVLHGKRFFQQEFGQDIRNLWLPDVFGYSAALPQILKKSGVDYFMTIKLSWSKFNKHPHHTFWWEGLDGSRILAHMPPEGTYNSSAAPRAVAFSEQEFLDKGVSDECLLLFGIGDGGGGPGEEHLERLKRERDLNGLAPVTQGTAQGFFDRLEEASPMLKTWRGELYLEYHQGTYTTQSRNKRYNRKLELALRELEFASVLFMVKQEGREITGEVYPAELLDKTWKEMLLYQFHDILPGSSIGRVYKESLERYASMLGQVEAETGKRYLSLCTGEASGEHAGTNSGDTGHVQVFNSLSWEREEWISHEGNWCKAKVPPMGYAVVPLNAGNGNTAGEAAGAYSGGQLLSTGDVMENDIFSIVFSENGFIKSIYDKAEKRHIIPEGAVANGLALYEDKGDAWDFPVYYDEKPGELLTLIDSSVYTDGPQIIRESSFRTPSGQSILEQKVVLTLGKRQIDFITAVDWNENSKMLRTSFPVNVYAQEATCEIQFGNIKRPTHRNTSWDMAKYEVYAHKWVDISQGDYGVALLNDCKYGHKVLDNILDLNLLRSTSFPGTGADLGRQVFTYSLFPHKGDYIRGGVVKAGYELNVPLKTISANPAVKSASLLTVEAGNIIVESVKKCEDSDDLIIRMYECHGTGISTKVNFGFKTRDIRLVDLMEKETDQESLDSDTGILTFKPFEIQTLKVSV
ncbi:alpha-mannosidase [Ruminiclostridium cellobioparum]|uniref:alpha-mannosidase n=1 Tax=Ruminiclostridium cellobioparum TaxID=29355 RepID=UPI000487BEB9|nr:glycoside hydrolase family 38 C-terminal domain-containing protein [Ruminiclostridium cellobioparum]